jgi:hypothetical protein
MIFEIRVSIWLMNLLAISSPNGISSAIAAFVLELLIFLADDY